MGRQGHGGFAGEKPGIGDDEQGVDPGFFQFKRGGISSLFIINEMGAIEEVGMDAVGQMKLFGQPPGGQRPDIIGSLPGFFIDPGIARDKDTQGRYARPSLFYERHVSSLSRGYGRCVFIRTKKSSEVILLKKGEISYPFSDFGRKEMD
jgi:hypothetical protein